QVRLPKYDHVVETFPSDRTDQSLDVWILPRGSGCSRLVPNAHGTQPLPEDRAIRRVSVPNKIARCTVPGKRLDDLVQENSLSVFRFVRLQEVHKFILLSGHSYAVGVLGINNAFYIQLSPDERAAVDEAALKAIAFNRESSRRAEQEAIAALRTAGVEFIELTRRGYRATSTRRRRASCRC